MYPNYTRRERIADNCVHVVGVSASLVAVVVLLALTIPDLPLSSTTSLAIYCTAMVAMFGCSAAYHLVNTTRWKATLKRFDHAAIF